MLEIKVGLFVKEHRSNFVDHLKKDLNELQNVITKDYSSRVFGLAYPLLCITSKVPKGRSRYWKDKSYNINEKEYSFCSEFGGSKVNKDGETLSMQHGQKFLNYLKDKHLLLEKYFDKDINFIVGTELNNDEYIGTEGIQVNKEIKNIILYGSPGVGKTHNTNKLIRLIEDGKSDSEIFKAIKSNEKSDSVDISDIKERVQFLTFHQSIGYEDFIEGFRPNEEGDIKLQDGIFKIMCIDASRDRDNNYYLVIDEINRGNISKIFGELITLIEEDKRDNLEVTLPYSKQPFKIPSNLYIIGTMNSTDKSIALIDIALRRRFTFLKMEPKAELITNDSAKKIFIALNKQISDTLGSDYQIGHSYFMKIQNNDDLAFVWEYKIKPLLEEYYYGDEERLTSIVNIFDNH